MSEPENENFSQHQADKHAYPETDSRLKLVSMFQEACKCSDQQKKLDLLRECASHIKSSEPATVLYLLQQEEFIRVLVNVVDLAIIPAFKSKEYFSYDESDFKKYPKVTYYVLSIIHHLLHVVADKKNENVDCTTEVSTESETKRDGIASNIMRLLPTIALLVSAHSSSVWWSSVELELLSSQVFSKLLLYYSCESLDQFFSMEIHADGTAKVKDSNRTLLSAILSCCWKPLSKNTWHQNPFLCQSFCWIISLMKLPHLSDYIEQIMSVSLNFLDDHQAASKIRGILCLCHLIRNTSSEEMRWLNRADVIYEQLKNQMYLKDAAVIEYLFPCLFDVLKIIESPPDLDRHQYVLDILLQNTEGENLLVLRKIYIYNLAVLVDQIGIHSVRHLKKLIKLIGSYLEVDDGFGDSSARPHTVNLLKCIIRVAWPRIQHHVDAILKLSLNFIADLICVAPEDSSSCAVRHELLTEAIRCLVLLSEVCPDVLTCVKVALQAGLDSVQGGSYLFKALKEQLAFIDTIVVS